MDNANHAQFIQLSSKENVNANKIIFGMAPSGVVTLKDQFAHLEALGTRKNLYVNAIIHPNT